jgi:hypothetical protein
VCVVVSLAAAALALMLLREPAGRAVAWHSC